MQLKHGRLQVDVPEGWLDQSTLLFVEPRGDVETVPARVVTPTVSVRFAFGTGLNARAIAEAEVAKMAELQPALERPAAGPFESPLGVGWCIEARLALGDVPVAQLVVAWSVGELGVIACAACGARELAAERKRLETVLRSIRL